MMFFRFILICVIATLVLYYATIMLQVCGLLTIKEDAKFKLNWKYLIPYYQYFKIFK